MTGHYTFEWEYKTHRVFHNWPRQRFPGHWLGTLLLSFLYLSEDSDQEHTHIKYLDTVKNDLKNSVTNEKP